MSLLNTGNTEIGLKLDGSVLTPLLKIAVTFAFFQVEGNCVAFIERLKRCATDGVMTSAESFKKPGTHFIQANSLICFKVFKFAIYRFP